MNTECDDTEMRPEYDFSGGVRGKYVDRLAKGANIVILDKDNAELFPDSASVNEASRALSGIIRSQRGKPAIQENQPERI